MDLVDWSRKVRIGEVDNENWQLSEDRGRSEEGGLERRGEIRWPAAGKW